jgi:hypothetical protein
MVAHPGSVVLRDVHWLLSEWLDRGRAGGRSDRAAEHSQVKPYTLRGLRTTASSVWVRVALLDDRVPGVGALTVADDLEVGVRAMAGDPAGNPRLGGQPFRTVLCGPGGAESFRLVGYDGWEDLVAADASDAWLLRFHSSTGFHSGDDYVPFPEAARVVRGLCRVWERHAPGYLQSGCEQSENECAHSRAVRTVDYALRPVHGTPVHGGDGSGRFFGSVGQTVIGMRARSRVVPSTVARQVSSLLAFSVYAGVGAGTARGYGATTPSRYNGRPLVAAPADVRRHGARPGS